jgi:hypothetical protein
MKFPTLIHANLLLVLLLALPGTSARAEDGMFASAWGRLAQASPEERRAMRERWEQASPEERLRMRREFQERMRPPRQGSQAEEISFGRGFERRRHEGGGIEVPPAGFTNPGDFIEQRPDRGRHRPRMTNQE